MDLCFECGRLGTIRLSFSVVNCTRLFLVGVIPTKIYKFDLIEGHEECC